MEKLNALYFEIRQRDPPADDENQSFEALRGCGLWVYSVFAQTLFDCLPTAIVRKGRALFATLRGEVREDLMRTETRRNAEKRLPNRWKLIFYFTRVNFAITHAIVEGMIDRFIDGWC